MAVHKKYNNGTKSNALGRGLDALISTEGVRTQGSSTINEIPLDQIEANPNQPRREFDDEALHELAESIKAIGIIQPITLRQVAENRFQIIAGERRWRASQLVGLRAIPAYIRTISDESVMEMALVENIQRQDLNAIEIALAYEHLMENNEMTQEKIAERVSSSCHHRTYQHADADHPQAYPCQYRSCSKKRFVLHSAHLYPTPFLRFAGGRNVSGMGRLLLLCSSYSDSMECIQRYEKGVNAHSLFFEKVMGLLAKIIAVFWFF